MSSSGEDEERGPSIDSSNPEERIAARRLRIQRRLDALKRLLSRHLFQDRQKYKERGSKPKHSSAKKIFSKIYV